MFFSFIDSPQEILSVSPWRFLDLEHRDIMKFHCTIHPLFWNQLLNTYKIQSQYPRAWGIEANFRNPYIKSLCLFIAAWFHRCAVVAL